MALIRAPKAGKDSSGIALFLVISAVAVLSILVTEFVYLAQINQKIAFDALDQVKVHYLAKSAFKISLLRLKAYQTLKNWSGPSSGGKSDGGSAVPKQLLDKIWSFPFFYPFPSNVPGMTIAEKDRINAFQKSSGLEGKFSALIESESGKYNLNMLLAPFSTAQTGPKPQTPVQPNQPNTSPSATPSPAPSFNPLEAQKSLADYITQVIVNKSEGDDAFAAEYRDFKVDDLMDGIMGWVDPTYQRRNTNSQEQVAMKRAPFYSLSELHMIPGMNDELYDALSPTLTAAATPGLNVNTMNEFTLRALIPGLSKEQVSDFFKFRDNEEEDNSFKKEDDFFKYLSQNIPTFQSPNAIEQFKADLARRGIRIVVDENQFKITVQAQLNNSVRLIEAWVTLSSQTGPPPPQGTPTPGPSATPAGAQKSPGDAGLKVTFMRIL